VHKPTTTILTIYWDFRITYNINRFIHASVIHLSSIRLRHSVICLASIAHKTVTIPSEIIVTFAVFATHDAGPLKKHRLLAMEVEWAVQ
jgi:hypothetical protein